MARLAAALAALLMLLLLAAPAAADFSKDFSSEDLQDIAVSEKRPPGSVLFESLGRWYILEVWSKNMTIDFGEQCIFFEIEHNSQLSGGLCMYKNDIFHNGTTTREPTCLVHDHSTDDWVKPGERRLAVLEAWAGYLALDSPVARDHWVLLLGREPRPPPYAVVQLARRLRLGSGTSPVRIRNRYPANCELLTDV